MNKTLALFGLNVTSVVAWITSAQTLFGFVAALCGALSGIMLVCINWEKFEKSKPMRALLKLIRRGKR